MKNLATKIFTFEACHSLPYHKGQCANLHGHSYKLEVTIEGTPIENELNEECGMIMDFSNIKKGVKEIVLNKVDHSNLNIIFSNPTAEVMCKSFFQDLKKYFYDNFNTELYSVKLWETATCFVEVRSE